MAIIVVTGSTGQLGSELRDVFQTNKGNEFHFLDRVDLDLSKPEDITKKFELIHPDIIIHSGAYTAVDQAESEPELADRVNHLATAVIAEYAGQNDVKLIYISTDYVFLGDVNKALAENFPTNPINIYGETKRKGELAVLELVKDAIIIRTSWVYSTYGKNFVKTMIRLMNERPEISVVSDQIASPTYAHDLALLISHIVETGNWHAGIYHYSNEGQLSWYDFALAIREIAGLTCEIKAIESSEFPTAAKRPAFSLLDKQKVKETFAIQVPYWKDSLELMLKKYLNNQNH